MNRTCGFKTRAVFWTFQIWNFFQTSSGDTEQTVSMHLKLRGTSQAISRRLEHKGRGLGEVIDAENARRDAPGLPTLRAWDNKENPAEKTEGKQLLE